MFSPTPLIHRTPPMLLTLILSCSLSFAADAPIAAWDLNRVANGRIEDISTSDVNLDVSVATVMQASGRNFLQMGTGACATGPALGDGFAALTVTAVVYQPRPDGIYAGIIARDNYGGPAGDAFGIITDPQDNWVARVKTGAGQANVTAPIQPGWHQLALTYDGSTLRLFVDGEPAGEGALSGEIVREPDTPLVLGAYSNRNGWYAGGVAYASIYDRALNADELQLMWATWQSANPISSEFRFTQAGDTHVTDTKSVEIVNDAVDMINADLRVAFSLWLGDLTQDSTEDAMILARMALDRLKQPRHTLRGNHDQRGGFYEDQFGEQNYTFEQAGWKFIMLDTNPGDKTPIDEERMQWLRDVLVETDAETPLVLCTHHPLYPNSARYLMAGAADVIGLFDEHNLKAVLSGHYHANQEEVVEGVLYTTTACLATTRGNHDGTTARGYRLFHCDEDSIMTEFIEVRDVQPEDVQK